MKRPCVAGVGPVLHAELPLVAAALDRALHDHSGHEVHERDAHEQQEREEDDRGHLSWRLEFEANRDAYRTRAIRSVDIKKPFVFWKHYLAWSFVYLSPS